MRMEWLKAVALVVVAIVLMFAARQGQAQEAQGEQTKGCPFEKGWKPENLPRILEEHRKWVARWTENQYSEEWAKNHPEGKANLCNAELYKANLSDADLRGANLTNVDLAGANLTKAVLADASLTKADLVFANLTEANLTEANLTDASMTKANLSRANLTEAVLTDADLTNADLTEANLTKVKVDAFLTSGLNLTGADLTGANLTEADLPKAILTGANLTWAHLTKAKLTRANLTKASLKGANLTEADLSEAILTGADLTEAALPRANLSEANLTWTHLTKADLAGTYLAFAHLTNTVYAPASPPPDPYLEGIRGLSTVRFNEGSGSGLVQLRELLQKAGLRDLEREATYALESNKTSHLITGEHWLYPDVGPPGGAYEHTVALIVRERKGFRNQFEGIFRLVAFEWTTGYGLYPARALLIIFGFGVLLIPVYGWPIRFPPRSLNPVSGIYRIWPSNRIEAREGEPTVDNKTKVERLQGSIPQALGYAAYFSLLSAFHIGWRDLSIGTWITRAQPREYTLKPIGWVRLVSGLQSLLSVYLLAIWALTYFGRPFQ